jgi:hypothetical protein
MSAGGAASRSVGLGKALTDRLPVLICPLVLDADPTRVSARRCKRQTIMEVVAEPGRHRHQAEALLKTDEGTDSIKEAGGAGPGVPFFVVNDRLTLSGAQQPETFLAAFGQALAPQ